MTVVEGGARVLAALTQRLRTATTVLLAAPPAVDDPQHEAAALLDALVTTLGSRPAQDEEIWLLLTAVSGTLPEADEVLAARRMLALEDPITVTLWLMDLGLRMVGERGDAALEMDLVVGGVVVDVNHTASSDRHTGIQRVVRETVPRWAARHELTLIAWTEGAGGMRELCDHEKRLVLRWDDSCADPDPQDRRTTGTDDQPDELRPRLVVPWRSVVVLPDVPAVDTAGPLTAMAQFSGSSVVTIGYDAIPIVSADLRPWVEPGMFVRYLTLIKYARRVAGISVSAAAEFRGFAQALSSQGLPGPVVSEVVLAHERVGDPPTTAPRTDRRSVLCVGSQELHKNHLAVMHAAERLWREGVELDLTFVGREGWEMRDFEATLAALQAKGRPVRVLRGLSDHALAQAYAGARFMVFPSLHEGYGLPVAEALAVGLPVITSGFGSMREIAAEGGCLLVDPRDDDQLLAVMRTLLTDDAELDRLRHEALARPARTWDTYADELWAELVDKELHR
ncbi:MAG TPA: glycosyltransferase family 1 protein [Cellulomonas sp.]